MSRLYIDIPHPFFPTQITQKHFFPLGMTRHGPSLLSPYWVFFFLPLLCIRQLYIYNLIIASGGSEVTAACPAGRSICRMMGRGRLQVSKMENFLTQKKMAADLSRLTEYCVCVSTQIPPNERRDFVVVFQIFSNHLPANIYQIIFIFWLWNIYDCTNKAKTNKDM